MNHGKWFLEPANATHRQYEALRAVFVDGETYAEAARKFGYREGTLKVMCSKFRNDPQRQFFIAPQRGRTPKAQADPEAGITDRIVALRKQNLSVYDIAQRLNADGRSLSPPAVGRILKQQGFAKLPRRREDERPDAKKVEQAAVADARELSLSERRFNTKYGGLFLFLPLLAQVPFDQLAQEAQLPGSKMIPAPHALRSILALKLFGNARHTHVMSDVFDEGLGLFAGLNVIPKASYLSQYSCRVAPESHPALLTQWLQVLKDLEYTHGDSFDLDFHSIPSHGKDPLLQKHYQSKRSRRQKGILALVANDDRNRAFCYVNADLRKETQDDEVLKFVEFWRDRTGKLPEELVFDSTFATYGKLNKLNKSGIKFITLRRRSPGVLDEVNATPSSAWRRIQLENVAREYRTPKILESRITLTNYRGKLRQIAIRDLGHEYPTILITNQMKRSAATLIQRYARRMLIENNIADAIDFFHMDALSSTVPLKVSFDLTATLMASTLYRLLAARIGNGYQTAKFGTIFRDFIAAGARVAITENDITVKFQKRAHNPMLIGAGYPQEATPIPWLGGKRLRFQLG